MSILSAALQRRYDKIGRNIGTLTLTQIDDVIGWTGAIEGPHLARLLIGQIASDGSEALTTRCVSAVLATDIQQALLEEIVTLVPVCRASLVVVAGILAVLEPNHPLVGYDLLGTTPVAIYDALDDGTHLFVSTARAGRKLDSGTSGLLLGTEFPLKQAATFRVSRQDADGIYLEIDDGAPWLERDRIVCPPMIAIF